VEPSHAEHVVDFPVLGEPIAIELANTRYRDGATVVDFLPDPAMAAAWFDASPTAAALARPERWSRSAWAQLVELRDATDRAFRAAIDGQAPDAESLRVLNEAAGRARGHRALRWDASGGPSLVVRREAATPVDGVLADLADSAITVVTGSGAGPLGVCANDDCELLFVRQHHRRRWCHNSCGHRHRQAAYARRVREDRAEPGRRARR
jgi:predicted RNA-binding Zn ribbon-like protein